MRTLICLLAAGLAAVAVPATARPARWTTIGSTTIHTGRHSSTILVHNPRAFREIRLCSLRNSVNLHRYTVEFSRGATQSIPVRGPMRPDGCTASRDLHSPPRSIRSVTLHFPRWHQRILPHIRVEAR
ncbi:MAG: hypothetical protein LBV50_03850 [Novosphingobium sp.]|jgi:hypothetical protein|nr:hypothetical protein [Novosphingobium sp.]